MDFWNSILGNLRLMPSNIFSMKHLLTFIFLGFLVVDTHGQIWIEDFSDSDYTTSTQTGDDNNLPVGADWTTDVTDLDLQAGDDFNTDGAGKFEANDIDGTGRWETESITIPGTVTTFCVSVDIEELGNLENTDNITVSYQLNGTGGFTTISSRVNDFGTATDAICGLSGSSVTIRIEATNNANGESYLWDNVQVFEPEVLYSTANGDWDDGSTWSTAAIGGVTCSCIPNSTSRVRIGGSNTVDLNVDGEFGELIVESTGVLNWSVDDVILNVTQGGSITIDSGGSIDENSNANANIEFNGLSSTLTVNDDVNGLNVDNILLQSETGLTISGSGIITLDESFILNSDDSEAINDLTDTFTSQDIEYPADISDATFTNNGTLVVVDDIFFDHDDNVFINNSTVTCNNIQVNNAQDNNNTITNSATATFNISNNIDLSNGNVVFNNSGIVNQTGIFTALDGGSDFNNLDGSTWNYAGADSDNQVDLLANNGINTFNYNAAGDQEIIGSDSYSNVIFSGSGTKTSRVSITVFGDLTIESGVVVDFNSSNDDINLAGNWVNNGGTFDEGAGGEEVIFDGTADQSVTSSGGETFNDFEINKTSGALNLNDPITITGDAVFAEGLVNSDAGDIVTFDDGSSSDEGTANSYINGPAVKVGDDAFVFPIGSGGKWARIGITAPTASSTFTAEYNASAHSDLTNLGTLNNISTEEFWILERVGTGDASVTLYYEDAGFSGIDDATDLVVARYNGTNWVDEGQNTLPAGSITTVAAISSFSPFTFGSNSTLVNPLPVEFVSFEGTEVAKGILLEWKTASELNNDFFEVQRSIDAQNWEAIGKVTGKGTTDALSTYDFTDISAPIGQVYYRLRQVDFDGAFEYSDIVVVLSKSDRGSLIFTLSPNPVKDNLNLELFGLQGIPTNLEIIDLSGKTILHENFRPEENIKILDFDTQNIPSGVYILKLTSIKGISQSKFIRE